MLQNKMMLDIVDNCQIPVLKYKCCSLSRIEE